MKKGQKVRHSDGRIGTYDGKSSIPGKCYVNFGSKLCDGEGIIDLVYEKDLEPVKSEE